jgi:MmyB-like transcription regulator ligand binding domain
MSFVETGRARPSREMVLRLARALEVPLRERNGMLLAAGFAPAYRADPLESRPFEGIATALSAMLEHHAPFPAVVMDRGWNVLRANPGALELFGQMLAPQPMPDPANVLELMLAPGPVRGAVSNWDAVALALLDRVQREAVGRALDESTTRLVARLRQQPEVAAALAGVTDEPSGGPVVDVRFRLAEGEVRFFSVVSTIGTPSDITAQELRIEAFFPSDAETADLWRSLR